MFHTRVSPLKSIETSIAELPKKCQKKEKYRNSLLILTFENQLFSIDFFKLWNQYFLLISNPKKSMIFSLLIVINSGCSGIHTYHFLNMFVFWTCLHFYMLAWQVYILTRLRFYMFSTICPYIHTFVIICTYIHTFIHPCIHIIYTYTHTHIHIHTVLCGVYTYRYTHTIYIMYTSNVFV